MIELGILGPLEARRDGVPLDLGPAKQRALLALLLLRPGEVVSRDRLVEQLWGERPPDTAQHALEVYVSKLRRILGKDVVETRAGGYAAVVAADALDAASFERLLSRATKELARDPDVAAETLRSALRLWRGPPLLDVAYEEFAQGEIGRLEELRVIALEHLFEADLRLGRHLHVIPDLEAAVREHPQRERLRSQLMLALYRSGRQADALEAYAEARAALREELGLEPGTELRELQHAILRQDPTLAVESAELRARRHLPASTTTFIGRDEELANLLALFRERQGRLVTLTGPGGSGKTRLALQAAHELASIFDDGVYFADLAGLQDPAFLTETVAAALGIDDATPLADYLSPRRLLLVLDNFEHLVAAASVVSNLLKHAPQLAVLTTSRSPLRIYGEHFVAVPPLDAEDAVTLFVERARAAGRVVTSGVAVETICDWLDRLPLAIELVAAQARELPPERVLELLPARLELAARGPRDVPERQRTLHDTIEWSYELLAPKERDVLASLSVFAGGFTLDAAQTVCGATLSDLAELVSSSLILEPELQTDEPRLTMLQTIREFALDKLKEEGRVAEIREQHAHYFRDLAARAEPELGGAGEEAWLDRLEADHENLRAALAWAAEDGNRDDELQMTVALRRFWLVRGHIHEATRRFEDALARSPEAATELRAIASGAVAQFALMGGDYESAKNWTGESLELFEKIGDAAGVARSFTRLGDIAKAEGLRDQAAAHYAKAIEVARELADPAVLGAALTNAGSFALMLGELEDAETLTREALAAWRQVQHAEGITIALSNLAVAAVERGAVDEARALLQESFELARRLGWTFQIASGIGTAASAAARRGDVERAARLVAAMDIVYATIGVGPQAHGTIVRAETIATCKEALTEDQFLAAQESGRSLSMDEAVEEALDTLKEQVPL